MARQQPFTVIETGSDGVGCTHEITELRHYHWDDDCGMVRDMRMEQGKNNPQEDAGDYEIIFDIGRTNSRSRFYCFIRAANSDAALLAFFLEHPSISYMMICDIVEV